MLLHRTRLAYVHIPNLLTDAKRDRAARVYGYVQVWLPEEMIVFFLQEGEVVNATVSADGRLFRTIPIAEGLASVPSGAEFGEVCFHQCEDEQLAVMHASQCGVAQPWPSELNATDSVALMGYLNSTMHDGVVEVRSESGVHYALVRNGLVVRGYFADAPRGATVQDQFMDLMGELADAVEPPVVRLWPVPPPLLAQAAPALIAAYRDVMRSTVARLVSLGADGAPSIAEQARLQFLARYPALDAFALASSTTRDPVAATDELTAAVGAWIAELLWIMAPPDGLSPGRLLGEVARERRHLFQSAGLFERLPWVVEW